MTLETSAPARHAWLTEARFGMFIHWGVYSTLGGEYKGEYTPWDAHIQWAFQIPNDEYARLTPDFDPRPFDARSIVRLAKDAGMKYLVFTAKHHDGFAMYDSADPFSIVKASPFGRDPLRELADACRDEGIDLCVYYSLGRDWKEPGIPSRKGNVWDFVDDRTADMQPYLDRKVKPQLQEILTGYGPIAAIWFDTPELIQPEQSDQLYELIGSLQPSCLVNARVGNGRGDYDITEQAVPHAPVASARPFETCITMNDHWAFDRRDLNWKSADLVLRILIDVASKGGNLLLNIGPEGDGTVPAASVERLGAIGDWMRVNGEAIHGTGRTAFGYEYAGTQKQGQSRVDAMGEEVVSAADVEVNSGIPTPQGWRCTTKPGLLFIHLLDWPGEEFTLSDAPAPIVRASFLHGGASVPFDAQGDDVTFRLPGRQPAPGIVVLKLELAQ